MKNLNWNEKDEREKPKVWHSINLEKAVIEHEGIEKIIANNWNVQLGLDPRNKVNLGSYYVKKYHGTINKAKILNSMANQMEIQHYPKSDEKGIETINGYTPNQIKDFARHQAEIEEKERKQRLEQNGEKFSRKSKTSVFDNEPLFKDLEKIRNEEEEVFIF